MVPEKRIHFSSKIIGNNTQRIPLWMTWLWRILRIILGAVLIYASIEKIINPDQFAYAISNYKLLPTELIHFVALILPWLEVVVGLSLIAGIFEWVALTIYNVMMIIFMIAIIISLIRGFNISCGCFTLDPNAERMTWQTLLRDVFLLAPGLGAYLLLLRLKRPPFLSK